MHELWNGAFKSQRVEQNAARVDALQFSVLEFATRQGMSGQVLALPAPRLALAPTP